MSVLGPAAVGLAAGFLGSILGLGGGVVMVPGLTLLYGMPLRSAVAVSLVGISATSLAAASVYLRRSRVDLPLALRLESAAVVGAVAAGLSAHLVPEAVLYVAFSLVVLYTAVAMLRGVRDGGTAEDGVGDVSAESPSGGAEGSVSAETSTGDASAGAAGPGGARAGGSGSAGEAGSPPDRRWPHLGWGVAASGGAGVASALLGIGGGFAKVPIMHLLLRVRLPVATATSALMVGMTAAASGWIYWARGDLSVAVAAPVALGVLAGSTAGSHLSARIPDRAIRVALALVLLYVAGRMAWTGGATILG